MGPRGDINLEFILSVMIVFIVFAVMVSFVYQQTQMGNAQTELWEKRKLCQLVSGIAEQVYAGQGDNETRITAPFDFEIMAGGADINVTGHYCQAMGVASPAKLNAGEVRVYRENGVVFFENL